MTTEVGKPKRRQKVQSVEIGMGLLTALSRYGSAASLSSLAQVVQMPPSKAHRYLRALVDSGLAAQDGATGFYRLGPEALSIGFSAIGQIDVVAASSAPLAALRDQVGETCILSVWANMGPTVVRIEPAPRAVVINVRIGSVLPLLRSATGIICAAFLDDQQLRDLLAAERKELIKQGKADIVKLGERSIADAKRLGVGSLNTTLTAGVSAVAAPVFDHLQKVAGVLTVMGPTQHFDESHDGPIAQALKASAASIGHLLGQPRPA